MDWYIVEESKKFDTHFASPERSTLPELMNEFEIISKSKIVDAMIRATGSLLAILNKNRQVLMINETFTKFLGINSPDEAFGLRPGELVKCVHANDMEAGCGTSEYCRTCGAVISIITALEKNEPVEEKCVIDTDMATLVLKVKTVPLMINDIKVLLLFADDISELEYCRASGNYFHNELKRALESMRSSIDILKTQLPMSSIPSVYHLDSISFLITKIYRDIDLYKAIVTENIYDIMPLFKRQNLSVLLGEVRSCFNRRYQNHDKELVIDWSFRDVDFQTDEIIFLKIISLLLDNAFEHTDKTVKIWVDVLEDSFICHIWNDRKMDDIAVQRVFQKFFSTKDEKGHGFGTFMAKFLAEKTLKGKLSFSTGDGGTTFSFEHPIR